MLVACADEAVHPVGKETAPRNAGLDRFEGEQEGFDRNSAQPTREIRTLQNTSNHATWLTKDGRTVESW